MPSRAGKTHRGIYRISAGLAALILILAQTAGAAHFHSLPSQNKYLSAYASADNGLCALCLVRFHSPAPIALAPHLEAPAQLGSYAPSAYYKQACSTYDSNLFGRAPPARSDLHQLES
jgi:hypothetical protein